MNVLLVVLDALRADRVGAYGGRAVTPTVDDLAADGTVFERAYSPTNATDPALTSLQTGRLPRSHGVVNHGSHVTDAEKRAVESVPSLPEVLDERGFDTGAFGRPLGRWHRRGFDRYPELSDAHWRLKSAEKAASAALYGVHPAIGDAISGLYNAITDRTGSDDEEGVVAEFESFLDDSDEFYSLVHLMDTHTPYDADPDLVERYLERFDYENRPLSAVAEEFPPESITASSLRPGGVVNRDNDRWRDTEVGVGTALVRAQYDAAATAADRTLARLLEALEERDLREETVVVVCSDHGESLGEHGIHFEHHGLYEPTVHVPLIVDAPDEAAERADELVGLADVAPTLSDYLEVPFDADGRSLCPLLEGGELESRESLLLEEANAQRFRGVRTDDWKYLRALEDPTCRYCERAHGAAEQLYDLAEDPGETNNLAEERPDRAHELAEELDALLERYESPATGDAGASDDPAYDDEEAVLDRLESLGYR